MNLSLPISCGGRSKPAWSLLPILVLAILAPLSIPGSLLAQGRNNLIVIPGLQGVKVESQDTDSICFETPSGKGRELLAGWLQQFQQAGWKVKLLDSDSMSAEYELTKGGRTLEVELDDPGFDAGEITIDCDSDYRLAFEGSLVAEGKPELCVLPPLTKADPDRKSTAKAGETSLGFLDGIELEEPLEDAESWWTSWWISPNQKRFAALRHSDEGLFVVVDGQQCGPFEEVRSVVKFSHDSQHCAFVAVLPGRSSLNHTIVIDGVAGEFLPEVSDELVFSRDGKTLLVGVEYPDQLDGLYSVRIEQTDRKTPASEPGHAFANLKNLFIHRPEGATGYAARFPDGKYGVILDGKETGPRFEGLDRGNAAVSADGQHLVVLASISPVRMGHFVDGKLLREHDQFANGSIKEGSLQINRNGSQSAWIVRQNGGEMMMVNGKPGPILESVEPAIFSPDGGRHAYVGMREGSPVVVIDGVESQRFAMAGFPEFSRDGTTIAYYAELGGRQFAIVNGVKHDEHDEVFIPVISDDGKTVAYGVRNGDVDSIVINGKLQEKHGAAGLIRMLKSPARVLWFVWDEDRDWRVVIDGKEQYVLKERFGSAVVSPDGMHVAVVGQSGEGQAVYLDGKPGETYSLILPGLSDRVLFDDSGRMRYIGVRDGELLLVER